MNTKQLCTLMCNGLASKIGTPELETFMHAMKEDWQMNTKQLCTFMCNGLASKIGKFDLKIARVRLGQYTLESIMCDGVASRILTLDTKAAEAYMELLVTIKHHILSVAMGDLDVTNAVLRSLFYASPYSQLNIQTEHQRFISIVQSLGSLDDIRRHMIHHMTYKKRTVWMRTHIR